MDNLQSGWICYPLGYLFCPTFDAVSSALSHRREIRGDARVSAQRMETGVDRRGGPSCCASYDSSMMPRFRAIVTACVRS